MQGQWPNQFAASIINWCFSSTFQIQDIIWILEVEQCQLEPTRPQLMQDFHSALRLAGLLNIFETVGRSTNERQLSCSSFRTQIFVVLKKHNKIKWNARRTYSFNKCCQVVSSQVATGPLLRWQGSCCSNWKLSRCPQSPQIVRCIALTISRLESLILPAMALIKAMSTSEITATLMATFDEPITMIGKSGWDDFRVYVWKMEIRQRN